MAVEMVEFWSVFLNDIKAMTAQGTAPDCFLSRLLESPEAKTLSSVEMAHITAELLTAGSETTGTSLQWFFKAMVTHPDSVREAQEELDRVVGLDRLPDWTDRPKLPYIGAMVTELHRWASSTPLAFFHATSDADIYRGKTINKATTVILNTYAIHNSDAYFPDHARYLPGRWLPADDKRHVRDGTRTASHMAFGTGRRECPGQHVADASLFIGISRILWAFNVSQGEYPPPPNATRKFPPPSPELLLACLRRARLSMSPPRPVSPIPALTRSKIPKADHFVHRRRPPRPRPCGVPVQHHAALGRSRPEDPRLRRRHRPGHERTRRLGLRR